MGFHNLLRNYLVFLDIDFLHSPQLHIIFLLSSLRLYFLVLQQILKKFKFIFLLFQFSLYFLNLTFDSEFIGVQMHTLFSLFIQLISQALYHFPALF